MSGQFELYALFVVTVAVWGTQLYMLLRAERERVSRHDLMAVVSIVQQLQEKVEVLVMPVKPVAKKKSPPAKKSIPAKKAPISLAKKTKK